ncbi:MAG: UDP binding domain-containing protein, partial [Elusimicrobiota bacterium]
INGSMPEHSVARMADLLNRRGMPVRGSRILVLGAAYKPDVNDVRESPSLDVIKLLLDLGAEVSYHDPHVPALTIEGKKMRSTPLTPSNLRKADLVAVLTAHSGVDYPSVVRQARLVFDARNATKGLRRRDLFRL